MAANYRAPLSRQIRGAEFISRIGVVEEEADETALGWNSSLPTKF